MRVLIVTSAWPNAGHPESGVFVKREVDSLRKAGIDAEVFFYRGGMNPFNYIKARMKILKLLAENHFDIIHTQFGQCGFLALGAKVPLVTTFRGSDLCGIVGPSGRYTLAGELLKIISRFVAIKSKEVIVVSEHLAKMLPPRTPFHVITTGVDLERFRPMPQDEARKTLNLSPDKKFVLFDGNPQKYAKRIKLAKKAIEPVKNSFNVELLAVSGLHHDLIPLYLNASDALLLTSKHEGSPTIVREALACNIPVVSVDVGDVRRQIRHIPGCVVCSDDSPGAIAEGLESTLSRGGRINGRGAIEDLDERVITKKIIDVYRCALAP